MKTYKGLITELKIDKYAFGGKGIAKISREKISGNESEAGPTNNYIVFVDNAYPGDVVQAEITKSKKNYSEAKILKIIHPSADRIIPECDYFGICGGCKQQNLRYETQLKLKQKQIEEVFINPGGFKEIPMEEIVPSERIYFYRNKMEFTFSEKRWLTDEEIKSDIVHDSRFGLGLHPASAYIKVVDIYRCLLQSELSNQIVNCTREFFKSRGTSVYNTKTHSGYLRHLVIRQSEIHKQVMVNIVTAYEDDIIMRQYTNYLLSAIKNITTIVNNINLKKAAIATGDYEKVFYGDGFITDSIGKYKFRISANSFFQTNTLQAEKLYDVVKDFADIKNNHIVYDLYSGAGTIAVYLSAFSAKVFCFESSGSAIADAEENFKLNSVNNVRTVKADLYKPIKAIIEAHKIPEPDIVITDPPRGGMHKNVIEDIISLNPQKIVYVSCNPATQVRDLKYFNEAGYRLIRVKPVDMFPHTYHIENVVLLGKDQIREV